MKQLIYLLPGLFLLATACQSDQAIVSERDPALQNGGSARLAATTSFATRRQTGTVQDASLDEISGLVESRNKPGHFWVHEDSGNPNKIYLINEQGVTKAAITLPSNAPNRDWEDIAIGPGPQPGRTYIYVADIGDNNRSRSQIHVHRFLEPVVPNQTALYTRTLAGSEAEKLDFAYAGGPRNAETLLIDPVTKDLIFITKEDYGDNQTPDQVKGGVYGASYPQRTSGTTTMTRLGSLNLLTLTGGDISANGSEVLLKNYDNVYYWRKTSASQSISQLLRTTPTRLPYTREPGGEAIGWKSDGSAYYTISEVKNNIRAAIYSYAR